MVLEDLFIDVGIGKESVTDSGVRSRRVELRASERLTCTTEFSIEKVRAEAHMSLDSALDELALVLELKERGATVK